MRTANIMKKASDMLLTLIYPKKCACCGKAEKSGVCAECADKLKTLSLGLEPLSKTEFSHIYLDSAYAGFEYKDEAASTVKRAKFNEKQYIIHTLADSIKPLCESIAQSEKKFDYIIPVPDTFSKKFHRGFSHTEILAKCLAESCGAEYRKDILYKRYETKSQHTLELKRRKGNLAGSMTVKNEYIIKGKSLLIADDIITTGNTVDYCAKILKMYGAERVSAISVCAVVKK